MGRKIKIRQKKTSKGERMMQPTYYPRPYPCYPSFQAQPVPQTFVPAAQPNLPGSRAFSAGLFGMMVVSTGTLGANLHHVADGSMTLGQAVGHSVTNGITGGVAAATATAAASSLTNGGAAGLAVTIAAGTGVSYLINKLNR